MSNFLGTLQYTSYCSNRRHTCGVFIEYSRSIHMYRLCIGYVSVTYRLRVGAFSKEEGSDSNNFYKKNHPKVNFCFFFLLLCIFCCTFVRYLDKVAYLTIN